MWGVNDRIVMWSAGGLLGAVVMVVVSRGASTGEMR